MNRSFKAVIATGLIICAGGAFAEDSMHRTGMSRHQMMKDCMQKQKTSGVTMSNDAMERMCRDEWRKYKRTGAMDAPPVDSPHN